LQKHDNWCGKLWQHEAVQIMKTKLCVLIFLLAAALAPAQTNSLTALLQQGLFEEQANRNLDAAIADYSSLAKQFDKDRQLAATAVFRIGECYRMQGKTNEAAAQYERVLRDFSDQTTLATLSQQDLTGLGISASEKLSSDNSSGQIWNRIKNLPQSELEKVLPTLAPDAVLISLLQQRNEAETKLAQLRVNYADENPTVVSQKAVLDTIDKQISGKIDGIMQALKLQAELFSPSESSDSARQQQKELLGEEIKLVEQQLASQQAQVKLGTLPSDGVLPTQQKLLELKRQLAALDANKVDLLDLSVPATDEEDQEIQRIQQMIQNSPDLINASGSDGNTPLTQAAYKGWLKVATYLMEHGADVNVGAVAPLNAAAKSGNRAMTELLLSRGADVNSRYSFDTRGQTPLLTAVEKGYPSVIEVLLANKADVNVSDNFGNTPLLTAARNGRLKIAQRLLAAGANPNVETDQGRTLLSFAAESGSPEIAKLLLDAKADPNEGKLDAPLLVAIHEKDAASAELLLRAGANPQTKGNIDWEIFFGGIQYLGGMNPPASVTPLFLAISMKQLPMVQLLLKFKADPNDSQTDGKPLLFSALSNTNILESLLNAGATVDPVMPDQTEWTPLAAAVSENYLPAAAILLKHGANPNVRSRNGMTPLHWAADDWRPDSMVSSNMFELLLANKADPNVRDNNGETPLDLFKRFRKTDPQVSKLADGFADLLRRHGALDKLPDWDRITVSRPSANFSHTVFQKGTNDWNQFTLLETICEFDQSDNQTPSSLAFADLNHIVVTRPGTNGETAKRIEVNLLNATNGVDCAKDIPLEFGDVVEIPEREHTLAEPAIYLPKNQFMTIFNYLRSKAGEAKLIVAGGQTIQLPLQEFFCQIHEVLARDVARGVLTSRSDLSRVKVTRRDATTGKIHEWIVDCSDHQSQSSQVNPNVQVTFQFVQVGMDNSQPSSDLWLRDGDVIEVP
jgi:ankyrin repeat protein